MHELQIPPAMIHEILLPMMFRMLEHGARAVMAPAATAACALFRRLTRERHRTEVLVHIIRGFAHSPSSVHRLAFVHMARAALGTFSAAFFCSHLLVHLLPLAHDASLAVRNTTSPWCLSTRPSGTCACQCCAHRAGGSLCQPHSVAGCSSFFLCF